MSDTLPSEGSRLGPYILDRRYPGTDPVVGHIYEARHGETGVFALVLVPHVSEPWAPTVAWSVGTHSQVSPPFLAVELERTPEASAKALHELTLMYMRMSAAVSCVEDREDVIRSLSQAPRRPPRSPTRRLPKAIASVGAALAVGLLLWGLWLARRAPVDSIEAEAVADDSTLWVDRSTSPSPMVTYPLPSTPLKGQAKPPCGDGPWVEINGGCWVTLEQRPPCSKRSAEHQGKCYLPVRESPPEPRSVKP